MICGIINIYKEEGYTSHDVVAIVKKIFNGVKTGHTGTLDPMARGVLPVCLGKATKIADYIQAENKTYMAVMRLGVVTDTEDITGNILKTKNIDDIKKAILNSTNNKNDNAVLDKTDSAPQDKINNTIISAAKCFIGEYMQTPPMYSAVKVNGQRLYKAARAGKSVERPARKVTIHDIKIVNINFPDVGLLVDCSKGVYIRALISDIGEKLGCGACMAALERTQVGIFSADDAVTIGKLKELAAAGKADTVIINVESVLKSQMKNEK